MATASFIKCTECGKVLGDFALRRSYGDGSIRCLPKCVRKYERRLNKTRGKNGRFGGKLKGL